MISEIVKTNFFTNAVYLTYSFIRKLTKKTSLCFRFFSLSSDLSSIASNFFGFRVFEVSTSFLSWSSIVFVCFSKAFPKEDQGCTFQYIYC